MEFNESFQTSQIVMSLETTRLWRLKHPEYAKTYYKKNAQYWKDRVKLFPDDRYAAQIKCAYGITLDQYMEMYDTQNGRCAICGTNQQGNGERLHVDHNHSTGKVRALLCKHCNHGLGMFRDSAMWCANAAVYLLLHNQGECGGL